MRCSAASGVVLAILLSAGASTAIPLPQDACANPEASMGVRVDADALFMGALDDIYVDGVVPLPVRLGLGNSNVAPPSALVNRGLLNVDVAGPDGVALTGTLELVIPADQNLTGVGQTAWLIWVGEQPFEPNTTYELEYSFLNDKFITCVEAEHSAGVLAFTTGEKSAANQLEGVTASFNHTSLFTDVSMEVGCCTAPMAAPCVNEGRCVACWETYSHISAAQAVVRPPVPESYFDVRLSLLAGDTEQRLLDEPVEGYGTFEVHTSAPEYCFHAEVRPRAHLDVGVSTSKCLSSFEDVRGVVRQPLIPLSISDCEEPPAATRVTEHDMLLAAFGKTQEAARYALRPELQPPTTPSVPSTPSPAQSVSRPSDGCAVAPGCAGGREAWLAALVMVSLGWRRRRR